ncbi:MAG: DUF5916 domain-containing protein [Bacteroidia bacterium]
MLRISSPITIDGELNEEVWKDAQIVEGFTQIAPVAGAPSSEKTSIKVMYDDEAFYVGAICYANKDNVSTILCQRDDYNANTDYISVMLDTYNDQLNGFVFSVSSMGVQYDAKIYSGDYSSKLDMVWYSEVSITDFGWVAEMKIPYSAIRFAKKDEQLWGINFTRNISKAREESSWNVVRPDLENIVAQAGKALGIKNITPPVRLFFLPYVSSYARNFSNSWDYSFNGGMDIKYGINEAFTLDMTLVPDFGQVVSDNFVLNLSPFEVRFDENRPFFTEGVELFEKADLFYSRRVGGTPVNLDNVYSSLNSDEQITSNPNTTMLFNASKFSGRNTSGLGIGIFNAVSAPQFATIENSLNDETRQIETSPLSNYNVFVLDQNLKNNSSVTLTNTNVMRSGTTYDANVTGVNTTLNTKDNAYAVASNFSASQKFYEDSLALGHNFGVWSGKQTGNFTFGAAYSQLSDLYDPNDMGFLSNNNVQNFYSEAAYTIYKPFWKLNRFWTNGTFNHSRLYAPNNFMSNTYDLGVGGFTKNFHAGGFGVEGSIGRIYDYFEPRRDGYVWKGPSYVAPNIWISTNYQKVFALDVRTTYGMTPIDWREFSISISPRLRASDKIFIIYELFKDWKFNQQGYAIPFYGTPETDDLIFGKRNVNTTINTLDFNYTMTNKMGITFRLRHYWSKLDYQAFFELEQDGDFAETNITGLNPDGSSIYNNNFNAFTIDMVYRWVFSPASELNIAWKNNIFSSGNDVNLDYFNNLNGTLQTPQLNSFSIRLVYFLDYHVIKNKLSKNH